MKGYMSGPISGLSQEEYTDNFQRAALLVAAFGLEPVNPVEVQACLDETCWDSRDGDGFPTPGGGGPVKEDGTTFLHHYTCYMKHDLKVELDCHAIFMLPNWKSSKGARFERELAIMVGMKVYYIADNYERIGASE